MRATFSAPRSFSPVWAWGLFAGAAAGAAGVTSAWPEEVNSDMSGSWWYRDGLSYGLDCALCRSRPGKSRPDAIGCGSVDAVYTVRSEQVRLVTPPVALKET